MRKVKVKDSYALAGEMYKSVPKLFFFLLACVLILDIGSSLLWDYLLPDYRVIATFISGLVLVIFLVPLFYFFVRRPTLKYVAKNSDKLQLEAQVLHEITEGVATTSNLEELLHLIQVSISKVMYAENCFFALYDEEKGLFSFPYFVDKYDDPPEGEHPLEKSCTAYILRQGKSMLIPGDVFLKLVSKGEVELVGSFSPSWMGIPLRTSSKTVGVLVLQHYEEENVYDKKHLRFLDSIAGQVANVIERKRAEEKLEKSFSLLNATLESTADGILVVDKDRNITKYNKKFSELWAIPESLPKGDDSWLRQFILDQVVDPEGLRKRNVEIYEDEEGTSFDILECKDSRFFERYSQPQRFEGRPVGRVWSFRDITERKRAERELRDSEEKLRTFFEKSPVGIEIYDANGIQVDINKTALEIFGISEKNDSLGFDLFSGTSLSPDLKEKLLKGDQIDYSAFFDFEEVKKRDQYKTSRQGKAEINYSITPLRSNEKVITGYLVLIQDITERRKAERELRDSEEKLRTYFEESPVGIEIYDAEGFQTDVNKAAMEIFGMPYKNFEPRFNLFKSIYLSDGQKEQLRKGTQVNVTIPFDFDKINSLDYYGASTRKGVADLQYLITPLKSHEEETPRGYLLLVQDFTERLRAELELREKENRYRTLFESANDAIFIMGRELFVNCNQMTLTIFECSSKEDFIGHSPWELSPEYQPDGRRSELSAKEKIEDAFNGKSQRFYWKHITLKGRLFDAEVLLNRVEVDSAYFLQAVVRDITEKKKADDLLRESEIRLRELNASKDRFFSIIAHDLKSPFNAIIGFSDLLAAKMKEKDYESIAELAELIQKSSERTMNLLVNLLEWARSQTGRVKFEPEGIPVSRIVKEAVDALKDVASHKSITVSAKTQAGDKVFADKDMVSTILRNLVSNALKFTNVGGTVDISTEKNESHILFKVKDSGVGIKKENMERLFHIDESYSHPGTLNEKGTGLGLLICKEFIEKNGGHIWVESEVGKGSTFSFILPTEK
jgi:PAS domain S-box-containing protein